MSDAAEENYEIVYISRKEEIPGIRDKIASFLREKDYSDRDVFAVRLSVEEGLVNAIQHGNGCDENKKVEVEYLVKADRTEIHIRDEGNGFDYRHLADCTAEENIRKPFGRGVKLMSSFMDEIEYNKKGNSVRLIKYKGKRR